MMFKDNKKRIEYLKKYRQTEKYKEYKRRYMVVYSKTKKALKYKTEYMKRYQKSNKGKMIKMKYNKSDKGKITNALWRKSVTAKFISAKSRIKRRSIRNNYIENYTEKQWNEKVIKSKGFCIGFQKERHYVGIDKITRDHIYPISKANEDYKRTGIKRIYTIEDMQPLCISCNACKQDKIIKPKGL